MCRTDKWFSEDGAAALYHGDCREVLPSLAPCEACVTDPPYGLEFADWDHGVPSAPYWSEVLKVLRPGGMLLAFGGTRTHHRLMCAIQDAGFEIRDCLVWLYGQGFPKSLDISKAVRAAGRTSRAGLWEGYGSALKPAWEPIILAMKPLAGTFAENALTYGVAGLNIDRCRVPAPLGDRTEYGIDGDESAGRNRNTYSNHDAPRTPYVRPPEGRWPANVVLDEEAGRLLDEQSGKCGGGDRRGRGQASDSGFYTPGKGAKRDSRHAGSVYADAGGASRFFYCAKASGAERTARGTVANNHPTVKPLALMRWLCRLVKTPTGGTVLDPFAGSGTTGIAAILEGCRFVGIEKDQASFDIAVERIKATYRGVYG